MVYTHRVLSRWEPELDSPLGKKAFIDRWASQIPSILGVDLTVVDGRAPHGLGPYLVVSNHTCPLDIWVAIHLVGGVILSHQGVAEIPVVGTAATVTDTIFVDRDNERSGASAIRQMRRRLRDGRNVIVFPEGTTFPGDEVRPFKAGAFTAAKGTSAQVLPIGLAYEPGAEFFQESFSNHARRMCERPRTPVWATIGTPTTVPHTEKERGALRDAVQHLVTQSADARDRQYR